MSETVTTPYYWDCNCDDNYIHAKSQVKCWRCGVSKNESPDSHILEVQKYGLPINPNLNFKIATAET